MSKLFVIMGKSFSGKDYLKNAILNEKEFCEENNIVELVRYTNRPMRDGEVDGREYNFINTEDVRKYMHSKSVISSYDTEYGKWHYITDLSKMKKDTNYITIADINDIIKYKEILPLEDICIIYLIPPNWKIFQRFSERKDYGDDRYKEIYRRFVDDTYKFYYKSNDVLTGVNSIVNVGVDFKLHDILHAMIDIINSDRKDLIILNKNKYHLFENNSNGIEFLKYNKVSFYKIEIFDGDIVIHTETEDIDIDYDFII